MYSVNDHPDGWGFPIRKSSDQSVLATPRSLSQPATSFIASQCQGIRQTPLLCLISRFVSETDNLAIIFGRSLLRPVSARSVQGTTPTRRPSFTHSSRPAFERCGTVELLDFQTSSDKRCQRTNSAPFQARVFLVDGGGRRDRTDDLLLAKQALSQLSYAPV
jgi:hypothetical protein